MVRSLSPLAAAVAAAGLLLLVCAPHPTAALSATLWDVSLTGTCSASDSRMVGSLTNLGSGQCFQVGQYGARVVCTDDGRVTQAALFSDHGCSIVAFSGSGVGDGISCIRMSSRNDPGFYFSTVVNCAAPGPKPTLSSSAKSGIIAGSVIVGVLLLAGGGWWCYRRKQSENAGTLQHSMSMQKQPSAAHYIPSHGTGGAGVAPGAMMALVCCIGLLFITSSPISVAAALVDPVVPVLHTYLQGPYCQRPFSDVSVRKSCELVSGVANVLRSHFVTIDCSADGTSATLSIWRGFRLTCDGSAGELVRTLTVDTTAAWRYAPATCFKFQSAPDDVDLWAQVYCPANFTRSSSSSSTGSTPSGSSTATGNSTGEPNADSIAAASVPGAGTGLFLLLGWAWLMFLGQARRSSCV